MTELSKEKREAFPESTTEEWETAYARSDVKHTTDGFAYYCVKDGCVIAKRSC